MRQQALRIVLFAPLLIQLCAATLSCGGRSSAEGLPAAATRYVVFVDRSLSPGTEQTALWTAAAQKLVFRRIRPGDAVTLYEITDRTAETAPLQDVAIPVLDDSSGMDDTIGVRRVIAALRKDGMGAITNALQHPTAKETRLLDSVQRIPKDVSRKTFVLYLTDALESSPELDLERTKLTNKNLVALAQAAVLRHGWRRDTLTGVTVQFVLDSPGMNKPHALNDHQALERFWRLLLTSMGADLKSFDSRIGD